MPLLYRDRNGEDRPIDLIGICNEPIGIILVGVVQGRDHHLYVAKCKHRFGPTSSCRLLLLDYSLQLQRTQTRVEVSADAHDEKRRSAKQLSLRPASPDQVKTGEGIGKTGYNTAIVCSSGSIGCGSKRACQALTNPAVKKADET